MLAVYFKQHNLPFIELDDGLKAGFSRPFWLSTDNKQKHKQQISMQLQNTQTHYHAEG